jgi:glycosyltransferase involved in cell wall biosynthesis
VSLTPVALDGDSRALKVAHSLDEIGFRSIVIEGRSSARRSWGDRIEVRSLAEYSVNEGAATVRRRGHGLISALREGKGGRLGEWALYLGFRGEDWWRHRHLLRRRVPPAALYYLHSFEFFRAVAPVAARSGARIVYDAHDFYRGIEPPATLPPFDRRRMRPFLNRLEDRLVAAADAVITVSDGVAGLMERTFGRRPEVVRNLHDRRREDPAAPNLRTAIGLAPDDCLTVVVGNYKPGMEFLTTCEAIARLPERFHLAFVGRGYERVADSVTGHPARSRIHLGHCVAADQVVPFIGNADLGLVIYTERSENYRYALPNGFFQIIAAGLPIIRGKLREIEAVIGGRSVGTSLDPIEPAALAQAIMHCATDTAALRAQVAELAEELRWQVEAQRLRQIVDRLVTPRLADASARG